VLKRTKGGIQYVEHVEGDGAEMFAAVCKLGLEGIVSKKINEPAVRDRPEGFAMKTKLLGDAARRWSMTKTIVPVLLAPCLLFTAGPSPASAATVTYTDSAAYFADAGHQHLQDFNQPISITATSIKYKVQIYHP
jgi:hypothetical protein